MSLLGPPAPREGKVSRARQAHQAPRERKEHGAMTVFESPQMPRFSVQKAQKERRAQQELWDPQDPQDQQARRVRKERRGTEASRACLENRAETADRERSVSLGPKGRRETLALWGLRGWQESPGPPASLGRLG